MAKIARLPARVATTQRLPHGSPHQSESEILVSPKLKLGFG